VLDIVAALFTGTSTWAFALGKPRIAFVLLFIGALMWVGVAIMGSFDGRPIYGMLLSSANTIAGCAFGWRRLR
jgi:hypothetical protein